MICGHCEKRVRATAYVFCPWCGRELSDVGCRPAIDWAKAVRRSLQVVAAIALLTGALVAVTLLKNRSAVPFGYEFLGEDVAAFASVNALAGLLASIDRIAANPEVRLQTDTIDRVSLEGKNDAHATAAGWYYGVAAGRRLLGDSRRLSSISGIDLDRGATVALSTEAREESWVAIVAVEPGQSGKVRMALRTLACMDSRWGSLRLMAADVAHGRIEWYERADENGSGRRQGPCFCFDGDYCLAAGEPGPIERALAAARGDRPRFADSAAAERVRCDARFRWSPRSTAVLLFANAERLAGDRDPPASLSSVFANLLVEEGALTLSGFCSIPAPSEPLVRQLLTSSPAAFGFADRVPADALGFVSLVFGEPVELWDAGAKDLADREREGYDAFLALLEGFDAAGERWLEDRVLPNLGRAACLVVTGIQESTEARAELLPETVLMIDVRDASQAREHLARMRRHYYVRGHMARDVEAVRTALLRYNFDALRRDDSEALEKVLKEHAGEAAGDGSAGADAPLTYDTFAARGLLGFVPVRRVPADPRELVASGYLDDPTALTDPWGTDYVSTFQPSEVPLVERDDLLALAAGSEDREPSYGPEDSSAVGAGEDSCLVTYLTPANEDRRLRPCFALRGSCLFLAAHQRWLVDVLDVARGLAPSLATDASGARALSPRFTDANAVASLDFDPLFAALRSDGGFEEAWLSAAGLLKTLCASTFSARVRDAGTKVDFELLTRLR